MRREQEERKIRSRSMGKQLSPFSIKKEGIQVILISDFHAPGVGKTSLLHLLTGAAEQKIGKFTAIPEVGIYEFNKIRYQIVDMPAIMENASSGVGNGKEILAQLRSSDLLCFCIDLTRKLDSQMNLLLTELSNANIRINEEPPPLTIEKTGSNKIQVFYLTKEAKSIENISEFSEKVREIVMAGGMRNAIVKIYGKISLDQLVDAMNPSVVYKKAIILGTKGDLSHTQEVFENLNNNYSDKFPIILGTSCQKENFPKDFGDIILKFLKKIRIYTMSGGTIAQQPMIMDESPTVKDVALKVHRSFYESFNHAIVIREGERQKRKKVGLEYELKDGDLIEIHTK